MGTSILLVDTISILLGILGSVFVLIVSTIVGLLVRWFWMHRERVVKQEDDLSFQTKTERKELATALENLRAERAAAAETARNLRALKLEQEQEALDKRVAQMEVTLLEKLAALSAELARLGTQVSPLWAAVQTKIAKDLTHPHPQFAEMDELLRQLEALKIKPGDAGWERLVILLNERIVSDDPLVSEEEKGSAKLMLEVMIKVVADAVSTAPVTEVIMVGLKEEPEKVN